MKCEFGKTIGFGQLPYPKERQCREKGDNTFTNVKGTYHLCDGHNLDIACSKERQ